MDVITAAQLMPVLAHLMDGALEGAGGQMWESLVQVVHRRRRKAPELAAAVKAVNDHPTDRTLLQPLATALEAYSRHDAEFGQHLRQWYAAASQVTDGQTTNVISGTVQGPAIQARDIHGGITFGKD